MKNQELQTMPAGTDLNTITAKGVYYSEFKEIPKPQVIRYDLNSLLLLVNHCRKYRHIIFSIARGNGRTATAYALINIFTMKKYRKIVHLALYSKKERVRKKNRNRILKQIGLK